MKFVRVLSAEIIQVKKTRKVTVLKCHVVETEFSQYCGHASAAGVLRVLKFCENRPISVTECKNSFEEKGKITIGRQQYRASLDDMTSHSDYVTGNLDDSHNCEVGVHDFRGRKFGYQTAQRTMEISLFREMGEVNEMSGTIRLPGNIFTKFQDQSVIDTREGTLVWKAEDVSCPDT